MKKMLTCSKIGTQFAFESDLSSKWCNLPVYSTDNAGPVTMSSSKSDVYMVTSKGDNMYRKQHTGLTDFDF
jgi:hypothetical protein